MKRKAGVWKVSWVLGRGGEALSNWQLEGCGGVTCDIWKESFERKAVV